MLEGVENRPRFGCYSQLPTEAYWSLLEPTGAYWGLLGPTDDLSKYMVTCFQRVICLLLEEPRVA